MAILNTLIRRTFCHSFHDLILHAQPTPRFLSLKSLIARISNKLKTAVVCIIHKRELWDLVRKEGVMKWCEQLWAGTSCEARLPAAKAPCTCAPKLNKPQHCIYTSRDEPLCGKCLAAWCWGHPIRDTHRTFLALPLSGACKRSDVGQKSCFNMFLFDADFDCAFLPAGRNGTGLKKEQNRLRKKLTFCYRYSNMNIDWRNLFCFLRTNGK